MISADPTARPQRIDYSLVTTLVIYLIAVAVMWLMIVQRTGGISYTVDDAYIHAAIAKNISAHGTFGFIPGEFAATSSSVLWTLLLAAIYVVSAQAWIPGFLAILFGALTIERANALLKTVGTGPATRAVVITLAMACAPVLPILSTGMEHTLHAWTVMGLFAALAKSSCSGENKPGVIFIWAALAAGARYESLFALPPLLVWLAVQRKWTIAFALGCGMALPVVAFAAYSLANGGYALPNSLMMKGNLQGAFKIRAFRLLFETNYLWIPAVLLTTAAAACRFSGRPQLRKLTWMPLSVIAMILIHLQLAQLGWFWRYEGYLVILGVVAAAPLLVPLQEWLGKLPLAVALPVYVLLLFSCMPLYWRTHMACGQIVHAAGNIHDQQLQMARVIENLGPGARIGINDLGAVSFFTESRVLDLYGLGDNRITRAKHDQEDIPAVMAARMREEKIDYVICYPDWFGTDNELPSDMVKVETWTLGDNLICGSDTVAFYGTSTEAAEKLAAALERYRAETRPDPKSTNRMHPVAKPWP